MTLVVTIDMLEKPTTGILDMMDEETRLPATNDESLMRKVSTQHKHHSKFATDPRHPCTFTIKHYAEDVAYDLSGWMQKNRDTLNEDVAKLMLTSTKSFISELFLVSHNSSFC